MAKKVKNVKEFLKQISIISQTEPLKGHGFKRAEIHSDEWSVLQDFTKQNHHKFEIVYGRAIGRYGNSTKTYVCFLEIGKLIEKNKEIMNELLELHKNKIKLKVLNLI